MVRPTRIASLALAVASAATVFAALFVAAPVSAAISPLPFPSVTATAIPVFKIDVNCVPPSTDTLKFTPPLTLVNTPTLIQKNTIYRPCTAPQVPAINSGILQTTGTLNDDCTMVLLPGTVVQTITWNTGQTTTMTLSRTAAISGSSLIVNFTGTVTAGLFLGSQATQTYTASAVDLINCLNGVGFVATIISRVNLRIYH